MPLAHPAEFFRLTRVQLFGGSMTQDQVDGTAALLSAWDHHDVRWVAYGLATAYHETDFTMEPTRNTAMEGGDLMAFPIRKTGRFFTAEALFS